MRQAVSAAVVLGCVLGGATAASAQRADAPEPTHNIGRPTHNPDGSPFQSGRPPLKERPVGAQAVIRTVADAMGFVRGVGANETLKSVNRLHLMGHGTMTEGGRKYQITKYSYEMSVNLTAAREDIQRAIDGTTDRRVRVFKGSKAWDETMPGVGGKYVDAQEATNRRLQLARNPFGFTRAMIDAGATVKVVDPGPGGTIAVEVPVEGVPTVATLNREYRPATITQRIGNRTIVASYPEYFDISEYGVMYPTKVVESVDGQVVLDVTIDDGRTASYAVFPEPPQATGN